MTVVIGIYCANKTFKVHGRRKKYDRKSIKQ